MGDGIFSSVPVFQEYFEGLRSKTAALSVAGCDGLLFSGMPAESGSPIGTGDEPEDGVDTW